MRHGANDRRVRGGGAGAALRGLSAESIRVARTKLTPDLAEKTLFIQADLSRLPLRTEAFDRVGSFGVYEHIPTEDARARALREMTRVLRSREAGGRFAFSAYRLGRSAVLDERARRPS